MISERHINILRELVNIGFGRAAASLSELTHHQVLLDVPAIRLVLADELAAVFEGLIPGKIAAVHQTLDGSFAGDALLVLGHESAEVLSDLLAGARARPNGLDESDSEVLSEVGNILLNAFVGTFGNLLQARLRLSVPILFIENVETLFEGMLERQPASHALVVTTTFHLRDDNVSGYVVMVFNLQSMDLLATTLESLG